MRRDKKRIKHSLNVSLLFELVLLLVLEGCLADKHYKKIKATPSEPSFYELSLSPETPVPPEKAINWHYVKYQFECLGFPPTVMLVQWDDNGPVKIEVRGVDGKRRVEEEIGYFDDDNPTMIPLKRKIKVYSYKVIFSDEVIIAALNEVWKDLEKYDYYYEPSVDGCWYFIETYDKNGIKRRMHTSNPAKPQNGSNIVEILGSILFYSEFVNLKAERCDVSGLSNWMTPYYFEPGKKEYTIEDVINKVTRALRDAQMNEILVAEYIAPECDKTRWKVFPEDLSITEFNNCWIIKQGKNDIEWKCSPED